MNTVLIDISVGMAIFILGVSLTISKFAKRDTIATILCALLTPILAIIAVFCVLYLSIKGKLTMDPPPQGLEEAEKAVEVQRQRMFGGELREPSMTLSWSRAYQLQLGIETQRVQRAAKRYFAVQ